MDDNDRRDAAIAALSRQVLMGVFNQGDAALRATTIERVFSAEARFADHFGVAVGHKAIAAAVEKLRARFEGFSFGEEGEPQVISEGAKIKWTFGPPTDPAAIKGTDVILVRDGRVVELMVFIDKASA